MIKILKNLTKKEVSLIIVSIILIVFQVFLDLRLPDYMSKITELVQTEGSNIKDILVNGSYMLLCAGGSLISAIIVGYLISLISATFSKNIRSKLFNKVESFNMEEIKNFSTSSLITRTTNDITNIQMFFAMGLQMLIKAPLTAIWAVSKILNKSWEWSVLTLISVLILLVSISIILVIVLPRFKIVQKLIDKVNTIIRE